ncbi:hypothetical protein BST95_18945 [Halioglobus japonicus]|uniref:hypothetical protein n=1 Tax=Halioglobus japonicus TaxID=930805 RepID=UPI0009793721|nr:hypothetical protein [Halioglobus japonicus]AQA20013.1 hypothetical protein BST95_18945 [Halioglobus japonicus]
MVFSEPFFLFVFLPLALVVINLSAGRGHNVFILAFSLIFYYWSSGLATLVLVASIVVNWLLGLWLGRSSSKAVLSIGVAFNLLVLGFFKYAFFFSDNILRVVDSVQDNPFLGIVLPIGISFYTFQGVAYLVDIWRKEIPAEKNLLTFAAYLMWDTHWTEAAGFDAMNQLFEARPGEIGIPQRAVATERIPQQADLAAMLALDASHLPAIEAPQPEPIKEAQQMPVAPLFLHDSFYERIMPYLVSRAPSASFERMQQYRLQTARETLDAASLVVFSAVQRNYPRYVWSREVLGWGERSATGYWLG